jgi:hypothetical protein
MNGASPVLPVHLLDIVAARRNPSLILSKRTLTFRVRARSVYQHSAGAKRQVMISMMWRRELRLTAATAQGEMKTMDPRPVGNFFTFSARIDTWQYLQGFGRRVGPYSLYLAS